MKSKEPVLEQIQSLGLLAVIRGPTPEITLRMVRALVAGGVTGIEITYTTPDAESVVAALKEEHGDSILLGMGTITLPEQASRAKAVGAQFLVSPHCEDQLATAMTATGLAALMGAFTPTEIQTALRHGADIVKVFPAALGGPAYFKSLRGPYPDLALMPTGGVSRDNVHEWFAAGAVAVGAGGELCPKTWALEGRFDDITARALSFVEAVQNARTGR
ncbi:MAG: bifunctional 4-hydroxy-2-oxoglutarate aldolase/2-dehydro-3-deoxy-phosphogluconate aldolase [Anaerolineales bacterium]|nr:bifunctional 4-hydroxy-2-oxoglutarate aldolase/2-dehydro-3-deoxy-phosphogluconate aldolase [Anaerolineales bacterium]